MAKTALFLFLQTALACGTSAAFGQAAPFPGGPGKDTVVAVCGGCHDVNRVRAGYTSAG
jgi:virginiamycin B lyase